MAHIEALAVSIGSRPAGTKAEAEAAAYIRDELAGYGYDVALQPFTFDIFTDAGTTLQVISPEQQPMDAYALELSINGVVEGEPVAAGLGRKEDFPPGSAGKIALIRRGDLFFGDKVSNAAAAGAVAAIIYNNEPGPFRGEMTEASSIPAVSLSGEDGQTLLGLLDSGPVRVRLDVRTASGPRQSQNVVARPPGGRCRLVAGGHYDSVPAGPGANDNASGTATVMEMARVLAASAGGGSASGGDAKLDDVCFVLFGAEEVGLIGSGKFVSSLTAQERDGIEGMLNFDMLSVGADWPLVGSREILNVADKEAKRLALKYQVLDTLPQGVGSDHASFIQAGIPAMILNCFCDSHYHTAEDRIEYVQEKRLGEAGRLGLAVIADLLAAR